MSAPVLARRLLLIGTTATALGIILEFSLDGIVDARLGLSFLNVASTVSLSMTILGLVSVLIGGAIWACHAPLAYLPLAGFSAAILVFVLAEVVQINIHGWTGILMFVVLAGSVGCVLILVIAAVRFALSSPKRLTRTRDFLLYCAIGISIAALAIVYAIHQGIGLSRR
jgi:hypothetical protein